MKDWISKLDDFLKISDKEYDKFSKEQVTSKVEKDFEDSLKEIQILEAKVSKSNGHSNHVEELASHIPAI